MTTKIYTPEVEKKLTEDYNSGVPAEELAAQLGTTTRSVIAKLSSMGLYKRKGYVDKRGEIPVKKAEYVDRIALLLDVTIDRLESLEKVNKSVLKLIEDALKANKPAQAD